MGIVAALGGYIYLALFAGLMAAGETVLLPAIFFATTGDALNLWYVLAVAILATTTSDVLWYYLGRKLPREKIFALPVLRTRTEMLTRLSRGFDEHAHYILFFAKYIYGVRIVVQVLAGMHKMDFKRYMAVNTAAIVVFLLFLTGIASTVAKSVKAFEDITYALYVGLAAFIVIVVGLHVALKKIIAVRGKFLA